MKILFNRDSIKLSSLFAFHYSLFTNKICRTVEFDENFEDNFKSIDHNKNDIILSLLYNQDDEVIKYKHMYNIKSKLLLYYFYENFLSTYQNKEELTNIYLIGSYFTPIDTKRNKILANSFKSRIFNYDYLISEAYFNMHESFTLIRDKYLHNYDNDAKGFLHRTIGLELEFAEGIVRVQNNLYISRYSMLLEVNENKKVLIYHYNYSSDQSSFKEIVITVLKIG